MDEKIERMLARHAKTVGRLASSEQIVDSAIGAAARTLLGERETVSAVELIEHFERGVRNSPSAQGRGKPEHDIERLRCEAAITVLSPLRRD